jgi:predicted RNA-binding Zn-ribbon protein involved in translation (DUF1610 family)
MILASMIKINCPKCGGAFKERALKIRGGVQLPCPNCFHSIVFDSVSGDHGVRRALSAARKLRRNAQV